MPKRAKDKKPEKPDPELSRIRRRLVRNKLSKERIESAIFRYRLRNGLLTKKELEEIRQRGFKEGEKIYAHFTDFHFLPDILEEGIRDAEFINGNFPEKIIIDGTIMGRAAEVYKNLMSIEDDAKIDILRDLFSLRPISSLEEENGPKKRFFLELKNIIGTRTNRNIFELINFFYRSYQRAKNNPFQRPFFQKTSILEDIRIIRQAYKRYKEEGEDFFKDKNRVFEVYERIVRIISRKSYFTIKEEPDFASAMNVALLYRLEDLRIKKYLPYGMVKKMDRKPVAYYIQNPQNLKELLRIMFAKAKKLDDIAPVYTYDAKERRLLMLWP